MIAPGKLVIDASVAVKWYVPEEGSEAASAILERGDSLFSPDLLAAEFGNVIWKKVRKGELDQFEAEEIIGAFISSGPVNLRPLSVFLGAALDVAIRWKLTIYDALYLAVAMEESCALVTADARLVRGLRGTALEKTILALAEV